MKNIKNHVRNIQNKNDTLENLNQMYKNRLKLKNMKNNVINENEYEYIENDQSQI